MCGIGGFAGTAFIGLLLTPYLLYKLGFEAYGFWIVLSTAVNYIGLMDLGIETTFIKYVAEFAATDQWRRVREVVTFGVLFYAVIAVVFAPAAYFIAPTVIGWMKISGALASAGPPLFAAITAAFFLQSAAGVVGSLLGGIGYLRIVTAVNVVGRIAFAGAAFVFTAYGFALTGLIAATFIQIAVTALCFHFIARRIAGNVFIAPFSLEWQVIRKLFAMGGWIQITNFATTITMETNRLIIAVFIQTAAVAPFELANKLTRTMRSLPFTFVVALLPAVSAMDAVSGREAFNAVYVRAARYLNAATFLLVGFIMAAVQPVCRLWLGRTYHEVTVAVLFLGCAFIIGNVTAIGTCMLRAIGQPKYEAYYFSVFAGATIAAMFALVPAYKLNGVLAGTLAGAIASTAYFLVLFHRLRSLAAGAGLFSWLWKIAAACAASCAPVYLLAGALQQRAFESRGGAAIELFAFGALYVAVFGFVLAALRFFEVSDVEMLRRLMPARVRGLARAFGPVFGLVRGRP